MDYMSFLNEIIKDFRPQLYPPGGVQPLPEEKAQVDKGDKTFMTTAKAGKVKLSQYIPISHTDVHKFVAELTDDNWFLMNLINEAEVQQEKERKKGSQTADNINA